LQTDEAGAVGWNPAGLYVNRFPAVSAQYYRGLTEDFYGALNFDVPLNRDWAVGAGLAFYDTGSFDLSTDTGESSKVLGQRDMLAALTGAYHLRAFATGITLGANLKMIHSALLDEYTALAAAMDLGACVELPGVLRPVRVGLAVKNIGTPLKYGKNNDPLPTYALLGMAYEIFRNPTLAILLAGDVQYDFKDTWNETFGAEVSLYDWLALRGGYRVDSDLGEFTMGLGFRLGRFQLDYAFGPRQVLDSLHLASLKYTFGSVPSAKREVPSAPEPEEEEDYQVGEVEKKPEVPVEKVPAAVAEIQRTGGLVSNVILHIGSNQGIKAGFNGVLVDSANRPLAAIIIRVVDPALSLAEVIGLGKDPGNDAQAITVIIDKPIENNK